MHTQFWVNTDNSKRFSISINESHNGAEFTKGCFFVICCINTHNKIIKILLMSADGMMLVQWIILQTILTEEKARISWDSGKCMLPKERNSNARFLPDQLTCKHLCGECKTFGYSTSAHTPPTKCTLTVTITTAMTCMLICTADNVISDLIFNQNIENLYIFYLF